MANVVKTSRRHIRSFSKLRTSLLVLSAVPLLSAWSSAQTAKVSGCLPDEGVVFSCRLQQNDRLVSLCSSPKKSPFASITYRYGTDTQNDLTYVVGWL